MRRFDFAHARVLLPATNISRATAGIHHSGPSIATRPNWPLNRRMTKTIQLTESQIEQVREILDMQMSRKFGCIAVVNFAFDRSTGDRTVELSFACLEWSKAVSICGKIKKLATVPCLARPEA
jgi:hypothetical protein